MGTPSVYISSTFEDLKEYRAAVFEALDKAGFRVGRMEGYAASDERPLDVCLQDVESRDIYVGIFAWRYGHIPPKEHGNVAGLSITECEYRHALAKNKPTLCFFHDPEAAGQWPDRFKDELTEQGDAGARIRSLRNEVGTEKMGNFFGSPYELAANVLAAVVRRGTTRRPFTVPPVPGDFIPRPEITRKVVTALLAEKKTPLAIHGAGGLARPCSQVAREQLSDFKEAFDYVADVYLDLGVTGFDPDDAKVRNEAVVKCLEGGLEAFGKTLPALKVQAGELALFPEDVPTPEQVLCELWGRNEFAVKEKTLRPLHNLSIVTWAPRERAVRLHNSVRAALRTWVPDGRASHRRLLDAWRDPMQLPHEYAWRWYGWHCLEAADPDRLRKLLLAPTWLKAKLEHTEVNTLVADCERLVPEQQTARRGLEVVGPKPAESGGPDPTIRLLGDALRNSSHVLASAPSQLCDQLFGRLRPGMSPELDKLCDQLLRDPGRQKLRARFANLEPAGSPRLRTLAGHENSVLGALLLPDGKRALSWSFDKTLRLWDLEMGNQVGEPLTGTNTGRMARCCCRTASGPCPGQMTQQCGCGIWRQGSRLARHLSDTNPA